MLSQKKETTEKMFNFPVRVNWHTGQGDIWWNETCAMVLEVFGLPGDRFIYHPYTTHMTFEFNNEKDQHLCQILLSDRI